MCNLYISCFFRLYKVQTIQPILNAKYDRALEVSCYLSNSFLKIIINQFFPM